MSETTIQRTVSQQAAGLETGGLLGRGLMALVALVLLLKLQLLFVLNVNWDEFHYLHWVYDYLRGGLTSPLQTLHVHLFTWLPLVSGNEVDQIVAARLAIYGLGLGSAFLLYRIGRRFLDRSAALFALLCYLSFSYVIEHGTSLRSDPIAGFFCLSAVYLVLRERPIWMAPAAAGLALAVAMMVTIKSAFYLPLVGLLLLLPLLRAETRKDSFRRAAVLALALAGGFAALYFLHRASLGPIELLSPTGFAAKAADKVIRLDALFPRWAFLLVSVIESAVIWACLTFGAVILAKRVRGGEPAERAAATPLLIFLLPLASFLVYRNAFPYFYVFILPLPMLVCGVFFAALLRSRPGRVIRAPKLLAVGLTLAVAVTFGKTWLSSAAPALQTQRQTIALAHRLFPEPVSYIDRCEMISSYRKVGFFMSSWGMENYLERGEPVFRALIARERPRFLIANIPSLDPAVAPERLRAAGGLALLDEDHAVLASNYVQHWGALYVAGKTFAFSAGGGAVPFEMLIPGLYTLEAAGPVTFDGHRFAPGETLHLAPGAHRAVAEAGGPPTAVLRWGERLYRPPEVAPEGPIFTGF